ncbi:MAG: hypothetical protein OXU86_02665 [Thaumarchaeota archaeon]|nr:hypothetical protein [Nitrososphaerota archaeon]MDD9825668.1 hypothetical protein [Nitrososphaerota archaeon]
MNPRPTFKSAPYAVKTTNFDHGAYRQHRLLNMQGKCCAGTASVMTYSAFSAITSESTAVGSVPPPSKIISRRDNVAGQAKTDKNSLKAKALSSPMYVSPILPVGRLSACVLIETAYQNFEYFLLDNTKQMHVSSNELNFGNAASHFKRSLCFQLAAETTTVTINSAFYSVTIMASRSDSKNTHAVLVFLSKAHKFYIFVYISYSVVHSGGRQQT